MTRNLGLLFLAAIVVFLTACSVPGDPPATSFCDGLDRHAAKIKEGKFDKKAFETEMKPLMDELLKVRDSDGKVPMSSEVLERWKKTNKDFGELADAKSPEAVVAYVELVKPLTDSLKK